MLVLAGDIGGTNTRLCLAQTDNDNLSIIKEKIYPSGNEGLVTLVKKFLGEESKPEKACLALAGPVLNNKCKMTYLDWDELDAQQLQEELNIPKVTLINDFVAQGYNLVFEENKELLTLQKGEPLKYAPIVIMGAGTALGKAFVIPQGHSYDVFPTEGGHTDFAPKNQLQDELLQFLRGHDNKKVSTESIVSGMGIVNIFQFLRRNKYRNENVEHLLKQEKLAKAIATEAAEANPNPLCKETMKIFIEAYGSAVGDMAVSFLPYGGIYITGNIAVHNLELMKSKEFMENFKNKEKVNPLLLEKVPINIVLNTLSGLRGAVNYAINKM